MLGYFTVAIHSLTSSVYCRYLLNLCFNELLYHSSKEHMLNQRAQRKTVPNTSKVVFLLVAPASSLPIFYTSGFCWLFLDSGLRNTGSRMSNSLPWGVTQITCVSLHEISTKCNICKWMSRCPAHSNQLASHMPKRKASPQHQSQLRDSQLHSAASSPHHLPMSLITTQAAGLTKKDCSWWEFFHC